MTQPQRHDETPPRTQAEAARAHNARADAYQRRVAAAVSAGRRLGTDAVASAPVGAGKTRISLLVAEEVRAEGGRTVVAQGSVDLCRQNAAKAAEESFDVRVWAGGERPPGGDMVYGVVNTMVGHVGELGPVSVLFVDEGHHAADKDGGVYRRLIDEIVGANPGAQVVMTSATPVRPDGARLHPRIEAAAGVSVTWRETIDAGMLLMPRSHQGRVTLADGRTVQEHARDLLDPIQPSRSAIGLNAVTRDRRPDDLVAQWAHQYASCDAARGRKALFFVDRVADAEALSAVLRADGTEVLAIHSRMDRRRVDEAVARYRSGAVAGLASVDMIGEGFDAPETGVVVNCKTTTSPVEYVQMIGRATRAAPGKADCHYLELGASMLIHGRIDVVAAIDDHAAGVRPRGGAEPRWRAWTPCGKGLVGIDLGRETLFARKVGEDRFVVARTATDRSGATRIVRIGAMDAAGVREAGRLAVSGARGAVAALCSDVDREGVSRMSRRLAGTVARHGAALEIVAAGERGCGVRTTGMAAGGAAAPSRARVAPAPARRPSRDCSPSL